MENEKNKVTTQVAQGVSIKTKVLLIIVMGIAVVGMAFFAVAVTRGIKEPISPKHSTVIEDCDGLVDEIRGDDNDCDGLVDEDLYSELDMKKIGEFTDAIKLYRDITVELSNGLKIELIAASTRENDNFITFSQNIDRVSVEDFVANYAFEADFLFDKIGQFSKFNKIQELYLINKVPILKREELKQTMVNKVQGIPSLRGCSCGNSLQVCLGSGFCANGGVGGSIGCFLEDTKISLGKETKNIQDIKIGDIVQSYDTNEDKIVRSKVINVFKSDAKNYFLINKKWKVTSEHPFWINSEWKKVSDITKGDLLMLDTKKFIVVESIQEIEESVSVYNIEVDAYNNYFANGALVHNKSAIGGYITSIEVEVSYSYF
jgi:uncharacterized protein YlzI (FlbEa/FlbD family)